MDIRPYAIHQLQVSRSLIEEVLGSFQTEDDQFFQPVSHSNPAIWIVGHLGLADNRFASRFRPETGHIPEGWESLFWFGTKMSDDRSIYPAWSAVVEYFHERRRNLLSVIESLTEEDLALAAPPATERGPIAGAPDMAQLLVFASFHEGVHAGQLTVCHRGLGHEPVYRP